MSKPCQDQFLHPVLVHYRKNKKIQVAKCGTPKKYFFLKSELEGPLITLKLRGMILFVIKL